MLSHAFVQASEDSAWSSQARGALLDRGWCREEWQNTLEVIALQDLFYRGVERVSVEGHVLGQRNQYFLTPIVEQGD